MFLCFFLFQASAVTGLCKEKPMHQHFSLPSIANESLMRFFCMGCAKPRVAGQRKMLVRRCFFAFSSLKHHLLMVFAKKNPCTSIFRCHPLPTSATRFLYGYAKAHSRK